MDKQQHIDKILNTKGIDTLIAWREVTDKGWQLAKDIHPYVASHIIDAINALSAIEPVVLWTSEDGKKRVEGYPLGDDKFAVSLNHKLSPYELGLIPKSEIDPTSELQWRGSTCAWGDEHIDASQVSTWIENNV